MFLTIIVPAYNAEKYIDECLTSLTKQAFQIGEHEVIVIDDCSTDKTVSIIRKYTQAYRYIRLIKNHTNKGVAYTRNIGLKEAKGKYIAFIDADDYIANNTYIPIAQYMEEKNKLFVHYHRTVNQKPQEGFDPTSVFIPKEKYILMSCWLAIYRKDIITDNNLKFLEGITNREDFLFNYEYSQSIPNTMIATKLAPYMNRIHNESTTSNMFSDPKKRNNAYNSFLTISSIISSKTYIHFDRELQDIALSSVLCNLVWLSIRGEIPPRTVRKDLMKIHVSLKSIKIKSFEGYSKKHKFKTFVEYHSRNTLLYYLFYYSYKIAIRVTSIPRLFIRKSNK